MHQTYELTQPKTDVKVEHYTCGQLSVHWFEIIIGETGVSGLWLWWRVSAWIWRTKQLKIPLGSAYKPLVYVLTSDSKACEAAVLMAVCPFVAVSADSWSPP